jgi:hypothetical protein
VRPKSKARKVALAVVGVLGAFGIFSAIGSNVVNASFPDVWEFLGGDDPVTVNVRDAIGANDGFALATRAPAGFDEELEGVDGCESLLAAAEEVEAVRVGKSVYDLVVEGATHRDVTIVGLRPEIVERGAPVNGAEFHCQSGGAVGAIGVAFDFDEPHPVARRDKEEPNAGSPYFASGNAIVLKDGEIQPIQVTNEITHGHVAWNLLVELVIDGESKTVTVDDDGKPFELTAGPPQVDFSRYYEWLWFENPGRLYSGDRPF